MATKTNKTLLLAPDRREGPSSLYSRSILKTRFPIFKHPGPAATTAIQKLRVQAYAVHPHLQGETSRLPWWFHSYKKYVRHPSTKNGCNESAIICTVWYNKIIFLNPQNSSCMIHHATLRAWFPCFASAPSASLLGVLVLTELQMNLLPISFWIPR